MRKRRIAFLGLAAVLATNCQISATEVELNEVTVTASPEDDPTTKKVGETKKSAETLSKQQVSDSRDLVKYETGVSVVETGRMGSSGYAIRGVDENRVAITVDGLHQAETLSSQGFKELFEGYGNFNNARNGVEMENVKTATITKGADSIKTGSGALGGSVMFETKDARDYLINKNWFYGFKVEHSSKNDERLHAHTLAARAKWFDFLIIKTDRDGRELKNYGSAYYDDNIRGREREKADPYSIKKDGTLIKVGFQPHEEHRFTFMNDDYENRSRGHDYSYTLYPKTITDPDKFEHKLGERYTDDLSKRTNRGLTYENFTETPFWDSMKISYSNQKIKQRARTEEYCRGDNCIDTANKAGLKPKGSKVVDSSGNDFTMAREQLPGEYTSFPTLTDSKGNKHRDFEYKNINEYSFDCSVFDCSGTTRLYKPKPWGLGADDTLDIDLSQNQQTKVIGGTTYRFDITEETRNGKTYKKITQNSYNTWTNSWYNSTQSQQYKMVLPNSKGYLERDWKVRDLNTDTKQLDLDFEKAFEVLKTEHSLSYGLKYAQTKKSMVNRAGFDATNPQWWANTGPGADCQGADKWDALRCPRSDPETSFLIPVESKNGVFHIADDIIINDYADLNLAYRYDKIKYNPEYIPGRTPKIPDDMVAGLFIPLKRVPAEPNQPRWWNYGGCSNSSCTDPSYLADLANYNNIMAERQAALDANARNPQENIAYLSKPKEYKNDSYAVGVNFNPFEFLRIQTKYSKGFRAPTSEELYFTFKHPDFTIKPNVDLKPELATTKEIALTFHNDSSFVTLSKFKTDYENFLDLQFLGTKRLNTGAGVDSGLDFDMYQNVNRQKAEVSGIEINSRLNLGDVTDKLGGFYLGYKLTKQEGKILTQQDGRVPMNAIQPRTSVYTLGYASKNDKFGADLYITDVAAKKAEDTYNMFWRNERPHNPPTPSDYINGRLVKDYRAHWLSSGYRVIDLVAYTKPVKNLTFRLGLYNITDEKYITWESARSIRSFGTTNMVRKSDSLGINRFYAPGRNFKLTFEMTF